MKRNVMGMVSVMLLAAVCPAAEKLGADISAAERSQALLQLNDSRKALAAAVAGLSPAQWKYKAGPERWSIAEVVEHLALVEEFIDHGVFSQLSGAPAPGADHDAKKVDAMVEAKMPDRSVKYKAPEMIQPTGRWTPEASLEHFMAGRAKAVAVLQAAHDLRGHVVSHPAFGPLDGYEWILALAGHTARHTAQILEVKADAGYPSKK